MSGQPYNYRDFFSYVQVEFCALPLFLSLSTMRRGGLFLEGMNIENQPAILDPSCLWGISGNSSTQIHELAKLCSPQVIMTVIMLSALFHEVVLVVKVAPKRHIPSWFFLFIK